MKTLLNNKTFLVAMMLVIGIAFAGFAEDALYIDANGNVGIGTTSPGHKLDVNGNIQFNSVITTPGRMHINGGERCYILNKDGVIIGKEWGGNGYLQVQGKLDVFGSIKSNSGIFYSGTRPNFFLALQGDRHMVLYDNGAPIWWTGTNVSDIRLKKDIKNLEPVLDIVNNLNAIRFHYKKGVYNDKPQIGLVAQELEEFFPELIYTDTSSGRKLIDYDKVSVILLQAIKEQQNSINELQSELASLKGKEIKKQTLLDKIIAIF